MSSIFTRAHSMLPVTVMASALALATFTFSITNLARADNAGFALAPKSASIAIDARGLTELMAAGNAASLRPVLESVAGRPALVTFDVLARRCKTGSDAIARDVFSGRVAFSLSTVASDDPNAKEPESVWMFGIEADDARCERVLTMLGAKLRAPGYFDAAAERLVIRRVGGWLLLAPMPHGEALLESASKRVAHEDPSVSLLGDPLVQSLLASDAPVRIFLRHEQPMGGASCVGIRAREAKAAEGAHAAVAPGLRAEIDGIYESAPLGDSAAAGSLDRHLVGAFEDRAVMVVSNPCSGLSSKSDGYWLALVPELNASPAMRANLAGERLLLVGACPKHPMPVMAVAWRVEDAEQAKGEQDHFMQGVCCGLTRANELSSDAQPASTADALSPTRQQRPLGQFFDRYLGKPFKLGESALCWGTVATPCGGWQVYASDPDWLEDVSVRLKSSSCHEGERRIASGVGFCNGPKAAALLRRWRPMVDDDASLDAPRGEVPVNASAKGVAPGIRALANTIDQLGRVRFEYEISSIGHVRAIVDFESLGSLEGQHDDGHVRPARADGVH